MPRPKAHVVELSAPDRAALTTLVTTSSSRSDRMIRRARVLLELDVRQGPVADRAVIADRVGLSGESVRLIAQRFVETGGDVEATITRRPRLTPPMPSVVTGEVEARLIALACSSPPAGHARWSLRLLEKHVALVEDVPSLDHATIGRVLNRRNFILI